MFDYIEKLRQKPESAKKRMAFLVSFFIVGVIFVVWLSIIFPSLEEQKNIADKAAKNEPSPFSTFVSIISQGTSAIGEQVSKIKDIRSAFSGDEYIKIDSPTSTVSSSSIPQ